MAFLPRLRFLELGILFRDSVADMSGKATYQELTVRLADGALLQKHGGATRLTNIYHIRDIISHVSQFVPARLNRRGPPMDDRAKGSTRHAHDFVYSFLVFRAAPAMSFCVIVCSSQHRHFRRLSSSSAARL